METPLNGQVALRSSGPLPQRRWTIFFRYLMALPLYVALLFVAIAAYFAIIIGWFGALFTTRNPMHRFLVRFLRFSTRISAYQYLLTDQYPAFSFDADSNYPIDIEFEPVTLSRVTVLFRYILAIPVTLLTGILGFGLAIIMIVIWVVALFRGSVPDSAHNAITATVRFNLRVQAYVWAVQNEYPKGLFGDQMTAEPPLPPLTASPGDSASDPLVAPAVVPEVVAEADVANDNEWELMVTDGGRKMLITEIVVGALGFVGYVVGVVVLAVVLANSPQAWSNNNYVLVQQISTDASAAVPDITASTPNWTTISADCNAIANDLNAANQVPQYPDSGPNKLLLTGLAYVVTAENACLKVVPTQSTAELSQIGNVFSRGSTILDSFLSVAPLPQSGY